MDQELFDQFKDENYNTITEKDLLEGIKMRVEELMNEDPRLLFSYMYRLDILEWKIKAALNQSSDPASLAFAKLILERQKERHATKLKYKQPKSIEGWDEW